jgi:predicted GNAT family acetyltransferase
VNGLSDPQLTVALDCVNFFYDHMFRDWPNAITRSLDGYTLSFSGDTRLTGANHLWLHDPDALTLSALEDANRFFKPFHAAWSVVCTNTYMPQAAEMLQDQGYYVRWSSPLMVLDTPHNSLRTNPAAQVIRASTPRHIEAVIAVMSEAFATDSSVNQRVARTNHLTDPNIIHYLVYSGGEPAACATVALQGRMAGIWNVGTRYIFRRQRFATTLMCALLDDLRQNGCTASTLMSSASGLPLYEQLGYRQIGVTAYMGPPYYRSY